MLKNALSPKKVVCSLYIFRKMGNIKMKGNEYKNEREQLKKTSFFV